MGQHAARDILGQRPRPTAVFAANDYMAIGLLSATASASAHEAPNASVVIPAVFEATQKATLNTIQPIGCTIHCE